MKFLHTTVARVGRAISLWIFMLLFMACEIEFTPPSDGPQIKAFTVEYDFITDFDVGSAYEEVHDNPLISFGLAGLQLISPRDQIDQNTGKLPFYIPGNSGSLFPNNEQLLRNYAATYRNPINGKYMDFHFLSVNWYEPNQFTGAENITSGRSISGTPDNQTPIPPSERYSMIFWGDIKQANISELRRKEIAVSASVHELGHQRVALTEFSTTTGFHNPNQTNCIMQEKMDDITLPDYRINPRFCLDNDQNPMNSCNDILRNSNP